jgi:uncharacterized repeat protein (TIGR03803 family)/VCBS repeat-containing protein
LPITALIADANGDLFGTTEDGGAIGPGTVFALVKSGSTYTLNTLVSFSGASLGGQPTNCLIADAKGDLFGTTQGGGANSLGTVFELVKSGSTYTLNTLVSFNGSNGATPTGPLIVDDNGDLFGATQDGGASNDGAVFELVKSGSTYTLNTLVSFSGSNGAGPTSGLIADAKGDLFGTTQGGGAYGQGTVFELVKSGSTYTLNTLVSFNGSDGATPIGGLVADANGDLFGTTDWGGANGQGTVFEITGSGFVVATPTVVPDRTGVNVGASVTGNVLAKDTDPIAGDTLHVSAVNGQPPVKHTIVVAGKYGSLTLNADNGSYTYSAPSSDVLPASGVAEDVFTYTASTGPGGTASSTLTVTVVAAGLNYLGGQPGVTITPPSGGHSPVLDGGAGNDTLIATNGATVLIGGPGDILTGGKGTDTYAFLGQFGPNTITNYNANKDIIELDHSNSQFKDLAAVQAATHQVGTGANAYTVITDHMGDTITLTGVSLSQLHFDASHFLLV